MRIDFQGYDMEYLKFAFLTILLTSSGSALAAPVDCTASGISCETYGLNENNIGLGTGIDYAEVTIWDTTADNDIHFEVVLNHAFFDEGSNFGLQSFYFNSTVDTTLLLGSGPVNWSFSEDYGTNPIGTVPGEGFQASQFGRFNIKYAGTGNTREDPLEFTLRTTGDSLMSYALNNSAGFAFAAHIADFDLANCCNKTEDSGWFSTPATPSPIPVPAAFWLFGTALLGFIGVSRRTKV